MQLSSLSSFSRFLEARFLQSWKTPMPSGSLLFFVVNTYLDNDTENQSLLCTEIMRRRLVWEKSHCISGLNFRCGQSENMHTKIIVLHTTDCVYVVMCYRLVLIVFFIKNIWVFRENMLLI